MAMLATNQERQAISASAANLLQSYMTVRHRVCNAATDEFRRASTVFLVPNSDSMMWLYIRVTRFRAGLVNFGGGTGNHHRLKGQVRGATLPRRPTENGL